MASSDLPDPGHWFWSRRIRPRLRRVSAPRRGSARTGPSIEAYIRYHQDTPSLYVRTEDAPRGVTRSQRAWVEPGGPLVSMTWKAIPPGRRGGYFESYKSEIAAYEIDKLLELDMVPPKVERTVEGKVGVAVMWIDSGEGLRRPGRRAAATAGEGGGLEPRSVKAKMFHNLIGDLDPNLGTGWSTPLARHPDRSLARADHDEEARARDAAHRCCALGFDMKALTPGITDAGDWPVARKRRAPRRSSARRDKMQQAFDKLIRHEVRRMCSCR